jgi:hypothetical protein
MTLKTIIRSTYGAQAWAAFFGAFGLWTLWAAVAEGHFIAASIDAACVLLNGGLFCAQASLRERIRRSNRWQNIP